MTTATPRKKLIEVALPLDAINDASMKEKEPFTRNHPRSIHTWWARRPLASCRAVLFASLVDDPSSDPTLSGAEQDAKRQELFGLITDLVQWENSNNPDVLARARAEILRSTDGNPPPVLDPFCGGGSIPLEAQRLGLEAHGSDLNPVAVLITKALIEIPPKFPNMAPVHPDARRLTNDWTGAQGLAADVRAYGAWMRDEAEKRIGHLYPKAALPKEMGGGEATVIAWLWARTVKCPNPACGAEMPLVTSFSLSTKKGRETWIQPRIDKQTKQVRFEIGHGKDGPPTPPKQGRGAKFACLVCGNVAPDAYIKGEGLAKRIGAQLIAIAAEGHRQRIYLAPSDLQMEAAAVAEPDWHPDEPLADDPRSIWCVQYGLTTFGDLFTKRQLVALTTFVDLIDELLARVMVDAQQAGLASDVQSAEENRAGANSYAQAIATYLSLGLSRWTDLGNALANWNSTNQNVRNLFSRQTIPMVWDFVELSPFGPVGDVQSVYLSIANLLTAIPPQRLPGTARIADSRTLEGNGYFVCTDPPYYDNIGYSDLSDFFYVWLKRMIGGIYPNLFSTVLTPKSTELVSSPYRHGGSKDKARSHFENGTRATFERIRALADPSVPLTFFYAFKQTEEMRPSANEVDGSSSGAAQEVSTGWETMLEGLVNAGFSINATWPMRTERGTRSVAMGTNALASSIVLACRPRSESAPTSTRNDFVRALRRELPQALRVLQQSSIAPVDLAQAAIGPGMAIYTRYRKVLEPSGTELPVRIALSLINEVLDEILAESEGDYDPETRLAITWFESHGTAEGPYGDAEGLAKAKNASVRGLEDAGILRARAGKVKLLGRDELPTDWDPATDRRLTVWEVAQHLVRALEHEGEEAAAALLARVGPLADAARDLAYRLYAVAERKGWSAEAQAYNALVVAWPRLSTLAANQPTSAPVERQAGLPV